MTEFNELIGKTIIEIEGLKKGNDFVKIKCLTGEEYKMHHDGECCEIVDIKDIIGDFNDILNSEILTAEERKCHLPMRNNSDYSYTWTFYQLATVKGFITVHWYDGSSNRYEAVNFEKVG
jgi:hypothetical protein